MHDDEIEKLKRSRLAYISLAIFGIATASVEHGTSIDYFTPSFRPVYSLFAACALIAWPIMLGMHLWRYREWP
jgi:hypothetical protein